MNDSTFKRVIFDGFTWDLQLPSNIDNEISAGRWWDVDVHDWIVQYVHAGSVCVDAGANIGPFTMLMSRCTGLGGWVYSFEPCPPFFDRLKGHIALNRLQNVTAKQMALSDSDCPLICVRDGGPYYSTARVRERVVIPMPEACDCTAVETITIDDLWRTRKQLDFIKIDVDGWEIPLLRGAENTINEFKPIIVIELPTGDDGLVVARWLWSHEYILMDHRNHNVDERRIQSRRKSNTMNVLAMSKEKE